MSAVIDSLDIKENIKMWTIMNELSPDISRRELNTLGYSNEYLDRMCEERIDEIIEYTRERPELVCDKINHAAGQAIRDWQTLAPYNESDYFKFHSQTMRKIYSMTGICDYLAVIREKALQRILDRGKPVHILDFGASHGHFTIAAAKSGFDVTYADIGIEVRKFVQWKINKRCLKVKFAPIESGRCVIPENTYDYIVCLDVISHLPNLNRYMADFHSWLKDGGELFLGDDLFDFVVPWHLQENTIYRDPTRKASLLKDFVELDHLWANCTIYRKGKRIND